MKKILLVDDNETLLRMLELELRDEYEVRTFASSEEAVKFITENGNKIDIVVSDFMMPNVNGLQVLRATRDSNPRIIRILLTAYITNASEKDEKDVCHQVLDKSVLHNIEDLIKMINAVQPVFDTPTAPALN